MDPYGNIGCNRRLIPATAQLKRYTNNDIDQRVSALQSASPFKMKLLKTIHGDSEAESLIHEKFKEYRFRGEWFILNSDILEFIKHSPVEYIKK